MMTIMDVQDDPLLLLLLLLFTDGAYKCPLHEILKLYCIVYFSAGVARVEGTVIEKTLAQTDVIFKFRKRDNYKNMRRKSSITIP